MKVTTYKRGESPLTGAKRPVSGRNVQGAKRPVKGRNVQGAKRQSGETSINHDIPDIHDTLAEQG